MHKIAVAGVALLIAGMLNGAQKHVLVVAIAHVPEQLSENRRLPVVEAPDNRQLPVIEDTQDETRRLILADPQVAPRSGDRIYGQLSFLIRNETPLRIMSGRIVLRQYLDDKRTTSAAENVTVYFAVVAPHAWAETSFGLLRQKVKAFDVLAIECFFADEASGEQSVLARPRTTKFAHEFQDGETKAIIAKSYGRAKVE